MFTRNLRLKTIVIVLTITLLTAAASGCCDAREGVRLKWEKIAESEVYFMMAEIAAQIEAARALLYKTTYLYDDEFENVAPYAAMSKLMCTDAAMKVTTEAVQILGGYGCMKDHPVERMMRDAKVTQIYEGTNQIQRIVIMKALKRQGYPLDS